MERQAWEALQGQARSAKAQDLGQYFSVMGSGDDSLFGLTKQSCVQSSLLTATEAARLQWGSNPLSQTVLAVYHAALQLGLLVPGLLGQALDWGGGPGAYQFTARGIKFLIHGDVSMSSPGLLPGRVTEVVERYGLSAGIGPLVSEAQTCWAMGCHRAAMVLVGLCVESTCTELLETLCGYPQPPAKGSQLHSAWVQASDEARSFYPRWQAGLCILAELKARLRKAYGSGRPGWWDLWEPVPGALQPYGEAVRIGRNVAAHSLEDVFTAAQVGLLLGALPTMLEVVSQIIGFLRTPPSGVSLPSL